MLVVVRVVQVLESVKEDTDACPVILPAEDGALDVVRIGNKPDRQTCACAVPRLGLEARRGGAGAALASAAHTIAIQVHRGATGAELEECTPLRGG